MPTNFLPPIRLNGTVSGHPFGRAAIAPNSKVGRQSPLHFPTHGHMIRIRQMHITYSLNRKDYFAGQKLHAKRSELSFLGYCTSRYFYPFIGVCILAFEFTPHHAGGTRNPQPFSVACAVLLLLLPVYVHFMARRAFARTKSGSGDCTVNFTPEMILTSGAHSKSEVQWSAIQSSSEDEKCFLLYLAPGRFLVVPKRACTPLQIEELQALFSNCITPVVKA